MKNDEVQKKFNIKELQLSIKSMFHVIVSTLKFTGLLIEYFPTFEKYL